jgi:hypothetical protein
MVIFLEDKWPRRASGLGSHGRRLLEVAGGHAMQVVSRDGVVMLAVVGMALDSMDPNLGPATADWEQT